MTYKKIAIVYKFMPQWRLSFFYKLKEALKINSIDVDIFFGNYNYGEFARNDQFDLEWGIYRKNIIIKLFSKHIIWQPIFNEIKNYDLIIVEQASKLILNYFLILFRPFYKYKIGFWGHGKNMQKSEKSIGNIVLKILLNFPDIWFAYTEGVAKYLLKNGVDSFKITVVQNTLDTEQMMKQKTHVSELVLTKIKEKYNIGVGPVCLFCGGLVKMKEINFLFTACELIHKAIPNFQLIILGDGPLKNEVYDWANNNNWIKYLGPKFDEEKSFIFMISDLLLIPGLIGLAIIESFVFETPLITTSKNLPFRSPEIEYLKQGENGLITDYDIFCYSSTIIELLKNKNNLAKLKNGCRSASKIYSIEKMVENFNNGIINSLN